jgi:replicative superfamily II helicase
MVDFKKHIAQSATSKKVHPSELYESLDRASDKGPLRPAQSAVLEEWFAKRRTDRDVILKLHTGQGKTLVGLLMLQSQLNDGKERALYLCPNNMLVDQTCDQARQFGIHVVTADPDLPDEFFNGKAILVASVQKLFNGLTKFRLGAKSIQVGTILLDDCHACIDAIRTSFVISIKKDHPAYSPLIELFASDLDHQGAGTFAEVRQGVYEVLLPVPYWAWRDRITAVTKILAERKESDGVKFVWPLIKDALEHCQCIVSGTEIQIVPFKAPLDQFGTYHDAKHRLFMSATVTDDSFLVKGLGLSEGTITNPLIYKEEKWSGEKMILIPSLIDGALDRSTILKHYAVGRDRKAAKYGIVALTPSFRVAKEWEKAGALAADTKSVVQYVTNLRTGERSKTIAFANRYDGIDLPDDACRVLILDSRPTPESLLDRYDEMCRPHSEAVAIKAARVIEQGLGRSVRGERDYSVIVLTGGDLVKHLRGYESHQYFSDQTRTQMEIGIAAASLAKQEVESKTRTGLEAFLEVTSQCLKRDDGWKEFYSQEMNKMVRKQTPAKMLRVFAEEHRAEQLAQSSAIDAAIKILQTIIDTYVRTPEDKGWYLQEMARYRYADSRAESSKLQLEAHRQNRNLLKPKDGLIVSRIGLVSSKRMESIIDWIAKFSSYDDLNVAVQGVADNLRFGIDADTFERALDELGQAIGFETQRPDKEWGEGPDNLWAVRKNNFILWECKNEVDVDRKQIHKQETGQMNNAVAWFNKNYPGASAKKTMIIPTTKLGKGAGFTEAAEIMRVAELKKLTDATRALFREFRTQDLKSLSVANVQKLINEHKLSEEDLLTGYTKKPQEP